MSRDDRIAISTVRRDRDYQIQPHFHRLNELYFLNEGHSKMFIDTKLYDLKPGDLVFLRHGRIHKTMAGDSLYHIRTVLMFPDKIIQDLLEVKSEIFDIDQIDSKVIYISEFNRSDLKNIFAKIEKELNSVDDMTDNMVSCYINELIIYILRKNLGNTQTMTNNKNVLDDVAQSAIKYICKNYNKKITLESISEHINMSPTYFSKKFKKDTGFGFKEYLNKIRLREAAKILKSDTAFSITEIAGMCGFNDSNYFATAFKAEYGVSPNRFRHITDL